MTQNTPIIGSNKTGLQYRQADNDGKQALLNHHKGPTAPTYKEAGVIWLDDTSTPWLLKFYDGTDWITLGDIHAANNTFNPYIGTAALRLLNHATDTGAANAYAVAPSPAVTAYSAGQTVTLKPVNANTGAATIAVSGLTAKNIKLQDGSNPGANAMLTTGIYVLVYDGTNFVLTNPSAAAATVPLLARGTALASASTVDIGAADSDFVEISGTTTITSLGTTTTRNHIWLKFQGALTLTHNATSLILPTGANITTAAGDKAEFVRVSAGNWQCLNYERASGAALAGDAVDAQVFTASGTWTKPATGTIAYIQIWGAGGGGGTNATSAGGGGGGYAERWLPIASLGATETVTIGAGGAVTTAGGNSTLGTVITAYGGGAASNSANGGGGGGGGALAAGANASTTTGGAGGGPLGGAAGVATTSNGGDSTSGGGGGSSNFNNPGFSGGSSFYGGGGGGGNGGAVGGSSVYGGGGGAGASSSAGTSKYAGAGGATTVAGSAPAGGGGRNAAGARGEVRVYVF